MAWQRLLLLFPVLGWMWVGDGVRMQLVVPWLEVSWGHSLLFPHQMRDIYGGGRGGLWTWWVLEGLVWVFPELFSLVALGAAASTPSAWIKSQSPAAGKQRQSPCLWGQPCPYELLVALGGSHTGCPLELFF